MPHNREPKETREASLKKLVCVVNPPSKELRDANVGVNQLGLVARFQGHKQGRIITLHLFGNEMLKVR